MLVGPQGKLVLPGDHGKPAHGPVDSTDLTVGQDHALPAPRTSPVKDATCENPWGTRLGPVSKSGELGGGEAPVGLALGRYGQGL